MAIIWPYGISHFYTEKYMATSKIRLDYDSDRIVSEYGITIGITRMNGVKIIQITGKPSEALTEGTAYHLGTISKNDLKPTIWVSSEDIFDSYGRRLSLLMDTSGNVSLTPRNNIPANDRNINAIIPFV